MDMAFIKTISLSLAVAIFLVTTTFVGLSVGWAIRNHQNFVDILSSELAFATCTKAIAEHATVGSLSVEAVGYKYDQSGLIEVRVLFEQRQDDGSRLSYFAHCKFPAPSE